jgi:hypothetical protein
MIDINQKLDILYDLLVDNKGMLESELIGLIAQPAKIADTNKFASLLSELKNSKFIDSLILQLSLSEKGEPWLTDFLYATINLLDECSEDDEFDVPDTLISKLESWIINTNNKGELAWKAANLLKYFQSESAERIQLKKLEERGDFFLTYVECILGLLRYDRTKYIELVKQIAADDTRDKDLREACLDIINNNYY